MIRTQITLKVEQHQALTQIAHQQNRSLADVTREFLDAQLQQYFTAQMERAAVDLLDEYRTNSELIIFTALDGEELDAAR